MVSGRFVVLAFAAMMLVPSVAAEVQLDPALVPPSPPMNVGSTSGSDSVTITWDAPLFMGGASSVTYRVYKDSTMIADGLTSTSYVDHLPLGMSAAVASSYTVSAVNDAGESMQAGSCVHLDPAGVDPADCEAEAWNVIWWVLGLIPIP